MFNRFFKSLFSSVPSAEPPAVPKKPWIPGISFLYEGGFLDERTYRVAAYQHEVEQMEEVNSLREREIAARKRAQELAARNPTS